MTPTEAKRKVEELMGRRDAVQGEINRAQNEYEKFASQGLMVEAREAQQDKDRLQVRKRLIEQELEKLRKFW